MGFFLSGREGSNILFTTSAFALDSMYTFKGACSILALLMMAVRARRVGEGGSTCGGQLIRFSGPVARTACVVFRLRRGDGNFGAVAKPLNMDWPFFGEVAKPLDINWPFFGEVAKPLNVDFFGDVAKPLNMDCPFFGDVANPLKIDCDLAFLGVVATRATLRLCLGEGRSASELDVEEPLHSDKL